MTVFRQAPNYTEPLTAKGNTSSSWYRWVQNIDKGLPPSGETKITPGASPWVYMAPSQGFMIVTGGTVSAIAFSRTPGTFYPTGQTAGLFPLSQNDQLQITFSGVPTVIWVPQ